MTNLDLTRLGKIRSQNFNMNHDLRIKHLS